MEFVRRLFQLRVGLPVAAMLVLLGLATLLPSRPTTTDGKLHVVCTFLPMYVFTQNVVGDVPEMSIQLLINRDVGCPHSYSLTGQDLKTITRADVIVANGLGIEPFLDPMIRGQAKAKVITIADACDVMHYSPAEAEHEREHGGTDGLPAHEDTGRQAASGTAYTPADTHDDDVNPHTWVSPRQAIIEVRTLADKLAKIDPPHASQYHANATAYVARLTTLADKMESTARGFKKRNIVTGHPAFDYLARDLKLNVVATLNIIPGETPSASEMSRIIKAIRDSHAAAVFQEPPFADRVAQTIARDAGVPVFPLNPLNSDAGLPKPLTPNDGRRMYEEAMMQNLATLQQALE